MKFAFLFCWVLFLCLWSKGQNATIKGRLVDVDSKLPVIEVQIFIPILNELVYVENTGEFSISNIPMGEFSIIIKKDNQNIDSFRISVSQEIIEVGDLYVHNFKWNEPINFFDESMPSIALESDLNILEDEGISESQNISIVLNASGVRDPFLNAASFVFSQYNFRPRGYNRGAQQVFMNGIFMNDLHTGQANWSQWGGLNEATKNQNSIYGIGSSQQCFGGYNGSVLYDINAAEKPELLKFSYSLSNRSYNNRAMFSYNSGEKSNGWAYSISFSRRWAEEGYWPGSSFESFAAYTSISKKLKSGNEISLQVISSQNIRAKTTSALSELFSLSADNNYNPNWGWQDGRKRNARVSKVFQPIAILQYLYKPNERFQMQTSLAFQIGEQSSSSLDWYNAIDPRPDYYRNLPSYYQNTNQNIASSIRGALLANKDLMQINWGRMYEANNNNFESLYNIGGNATDSLRGKRALYALGADVERMKKLALATNYLFRINDKLMLTGGFQFVGQGSSFFRRMEDLLGADYFLNYNMFAAQQFLGNAQFLQNDLNNPNQPIKLGDRYRYSYNTQILKTWIWTQLEADFHRFNVFSTFNLGNTSYTRDGQYKNGLFAQNSFGKSEALNFINFGIKSGVTYKINGRNYLLLNASFLKEDPGINNVFIAPRVRNQVVQNPQLQQIQSIETGYLLRAPKANIRAIGYVTDIKNAISIQRFYNDDPQFQSFVNFVMSDMNTRFIGTELAFAYNLTTQWTVSAAASIGQAFYTNRPKVSIYNDNDTNVGFASKEVFIKNYYLGVGPQSAYTAGFTYNAKRFWYCKINGNYFERNYVAINPDRRSVEAAEFLPESDPKFAKIFDQERLPSFYTFDLSGGKSWKLNKLSDKISYQTTLYFNIGISNILNNKNIITTGYEQLRYDFTNNNPDKFPNKYVNGMGRTFFANLSLKL